eukprot:scaffold834_cov123-Cylindrotheca_fusiformis.AAC.25
MIPGDPYNATTSAYHYPPSSAPQHIDPYLGREWGPGDDKLRWQQQEQNAYFPEDPRGMPHRHEFPRNSMKDRNVDPRRVQHRTEFQPRQGKGKSGLRSSIMKSSMVQKLKGVKPSGRKSWNLIPSLSRSRSLSPTAADSSRKQRPRANAAASSRNRPAPHVNTNQPQSLQRMPNQNRNSNNAPIPARRTMTVREQQAETRGSFDVDFDFFGDGFAEAIPETNDDAPESDGFKVLRQTQQLTRKATQQLQMDGRVSQQSQSQYQQDMPGNVQGTAPVTFSEYISKSKIGRIPGHVPAKISPTSVTDVENSFNNVRWSDNLSQSPTRTSNSFREERPRSILRGSRHSQSTSSDDYPSFETPSIEFVDPRDGRSLSPIAVTKESSVDLPNWMETESGFEKNIPQEYQEAFHQQRVVSRHYLRVQLPTQFPRVLIFFFQFLKHALNRNNDSDVISDAYNEFIESVASVVLQTAVRQFLAKVRVRKIREHVAAARKYQYNRKRIRRSNAVNKSVRSQMSRTDMIAKAKHENQLFELAAIRIQSVFRGWWVRDSIKVDSYCATVIQKNFRAYYCRYLFLYDLYRVVVVQSVARRYIVQKALWSQDEEIRKLLDFAARLIQARWRSFATEMRFLETYQDIVTVQSVVRGWIVRRRMRMRRKVKQTNSGSRLRMARLQKKAVQKNFLPGKTQTGPMKTRAFHSPPEQQYPVRKEQQFPQEDLNSNGVKKLSSNSYRQSQSKYKNSLPMRTQTVPMETQALHSSQEPQQFPIGKEQTYSQKGPNLHGMMTVASNSSWQSQPKFKRTNSRSDDSWLSKSLPSQGVNELTTRIGEHHQPQEENDSKAIAVAKTEVEKRREAKEQKRQAVLEEERRRKEREASHAAELKRMQQRVGVKKQSSPPMGSCSPAQTHEEAGSWGSRLPQHCASINTGDNVGDVEPIKKSESFDSDKETEIQSNRTGRSRILDGWRNWERSNSLDRKSFGDKTAERIKEIESAGNERLSLIDKRGSFEDSKVTAPGADTPGQGADIPGQKAAQNRKVRARHGKKSPRRSRSEPSIQQTLRAMRSDEENVRLDQIHAIFCRVGLMDPEEYDGDTPDSETVQISKESLETQNENPKHITQKQDSVGGTEGTFPGAILRTERRLFSDEETKSDDRKKELSKTRLGNFTSSYPPPKNETTTFFKPNKNEQKQRSSQAPSTLQNGARNSSKFQGGETTNRSKQLMQSLGLDASYASEVSTDREDERGDMVVAGTTPTVSDSPEPSREPRTRIPSAPKELTSEIHIQMKASRSEQEQFRLDEMHEAFLRVGLMHRQTIIKRSSNKMPLEGSNRSQTEKEASEPTATELIQSWRHRDQRRPEISGTVF